MIGFVLIILAAAYGAVQLGAPPVWIGIGVVILLGIGIISAVTKTRRKEAP